MANLLNLVKSKMLVTKPHFRHDGVDVVTSVTCQLAMSHHIQA